MASSITRVLVPASRASEAFRAIPAFLLPVSMAQATISQTGDRPMTKFYAQPYSIEHTGFYFDSIETFDEGMEKLNNKGCEEVEIQFIDGQAHEPSLFKSAGIHQGNISLWFDELEDLTSDDTIRLCFLLDYLDLDDALSRYDEVYLHYGSAEDYAQELIEETTQIPESLQYYIDYEAIARDMKMGGEIIEIEHDLIVTNAHEF
ncbi:MAG: antirestriction protein ArdA [Candidatus Polarisedimenticolaceae bacterium]|nr:antirestriction protein ArdA [Candidatus Polarisedimenticolaceae bacterium]